MNLPLDALWREKKTVPTVLRLEVSRPKRLSPLMTK